MEDSRAYRRQTLPRLFYPASLIVFDGLHLVLELLADLSHLRKRVGADVGVARVAGRVVLVVELRLVKTVRLDRLQRRDDRVAERLGLVELLDISLGDLLLVVV